MTVASRSASGWWPNLVTLDCADCGASWTVDVNDSRWTYASFIRQQIAAHEEWCEARK